MTIKHFDKNISAEKKNILTNATFNNGLLIFTVEDLFEDGQARLKTPIEINLQDHKLKLKIVTSSRLTELSNSVNPSDIEERESFIFLVPFQADEEGTYREYIWIVENEGQQNESGKFEVIGSTKIDLTNYIQKSNTSGVIKNNGDILAIDNTSGGTGSSASLITSGAVNAGLNGKANSTHNHTSTNITDMEPITITITYTDNTTETLTLFKQHINNS